MTCSFLKGISRRRFFTDDDYSFHNAVLFRGSVLFSMSFARRIFGQSRGICRINWGIGESFSRIARETNADYLPRCDEQGLGECTTTLLQIFCRKYSMVLTRPSASGMRGSHFKIVFARVMSGLRCF